MEDERPLKGEKFQINEFPPEDERPLKGEKF